MKRHVWEAVKSRKYIVTNASSLVKAAADMPRVEVVSMSKAEIAEHNEALALDAVFASAPAVAQIKGVHSMNFSGGGEVEYLCPDQRC